MKEVQWPKGDEWETRRMRHRREGGREGAGWRTEEGGKG